MTKGEGKERNVTEGDSAEQQKRPSLENFEQSLAGLETEMGRLLKELKNLRKMLRNFAVPAVMALAATLAAPSDSALASVARERQAPTGRTTLAIEGMTCGGCVAAVKSALKKTEGVTAYDVSLEKKEAVVNFDPGRTDPEKIAAAVSKTGFRASVKSKGDGSRKTD